MKFTIQNIFYTFLSNFSYVKSPTRVKKLLSTVNFLTKKILVHKIELLFQKLNFFQL